MCQIVGYCLPYETAKKEHPVAVYNFINLYKYDKSFYDFSCCEMGRGWEEEGRKATTDTVMLIPKVGTLARHTHTHIKRNVLYEHLKNNQEKCCVLNQQTEARKR